MLNAYFNETRPEEYTFIGFYEHRSKHENFTFSFQKESDKLKRDLDILLKDGSVNVKEAASRLNRAFKIRFYLLFYYSFFYGAPTTTMGICLLPILRSACPLWENGTITATVASACCSPYGLLVRCVCF